MDFLKNVLLFIFSWIDSIIAKLITQVYKLLSNLSELVLYNENMVKVIGGRIGLILGIFMLFKLAVSLISYMISPEKINDNSKGGAKLIKNVIVSLVLLMSINFIFKEAYFIQGKIVNSRIIERIFFGNSGMVVSTNSNQENDIKMDIGYYLYSGFLLPNQEIFEDKCDIVWDVTKTTEDFQECDQLLEDNVSDDARKSIYNARNSLDMSYVLSDYDLITATPKPRVHAFNYLPLISNAAGIIVLLVLISFSMDLATRAIKLLFLQIIAPIPIISYMDMGKGQDIFKKWGKECINTYLSVFIRLIAINFAVFMIVLLRGNYKDVFVNNLWLNVFLIIGALIFAKQVPKLLEDFLGIKLDGMSLKPLKKFEENALFGKNITGLAAGAAAGTVGMFTHAGVFSSFRGAWNGMTSGKGFTDSWKSTKDMNAKYRTANLVDRNLARRTYGRITTGISEFLGTGGELARIERQEADLKLVIDRLNADKERLQARIAPIQTEIARRSAVTDSIKQIQDRAVAKVKEGKGTMGATYQEMVRNVEGIKRSSATRGSVTVNGRTYSWRNETERGTVAEQLAQDAEHFANVDGRDAFIDYALNHHGFDTKTEDLHITYESNASAAGETIHNNAHDLDSQSGTLGTLNATSHSRIAQEEQQIRTIDDTIKRRNDQMRDISDRKQRYNSYKIN